MEAGDLLGGSRRVHREDDAVSGLGGSREGGEQGWDPGCILGVELVPVC